MMEYYIYLIVLSLFAFTHGQTCVFGSSTDCLFPCNCANLTESCDMVTGDCTSGCRSGKPQGYIWTGPGCRLGNVAYSKTATASGESARHGTADKAIDGNTDPNMLHGHCFHSNGSIDQLSWFMVDLHNLHVIYNVTIFNRYYSYPFDANRFQNFSVRLSNESDINKHTDICAVHPGTMTNGGSVTLSCDPPRIAKYVSIVNSMKGRQHHLFGMCEIAIIGYKIGDCSTGTFGIACESECHCRTGGCDSVTGNCPSGCEDRWITNSCNVYVDCPDGHFGDKCQSECHCRNDPCDKVTGICNTGCEDWWIDSTCSIHINYPDMSNASLHVLQVEQTSVSLGVNCGQIILDANVASNYFLTVEYAKETSKWTDYSVSKINQQCSNQSTLIQNLEPSTRYSIRIVPYRSITTMEFNNNRTQRGTPTLDVIFATKDLQTTSVEELSSTSAEIMPSTWLPVTMGQEQDTDGARIAPVVGSVVGGVFLIGVVTAIIIVLYRKRRCQDSGNNGLHKCDLDDELNVIADEPVCNEAGAESRNHVDSKSSVCQSRVPALIGGLDSNEENIYHDVDESVYENSPPIPIDCLRDYIHRQKQQEKPFENEYTAIPSTELFACEQANKAGNKEKNRFTNIKPYDRTRVILDTVNGDHMTDYINASYITNPDSTENCYVACQGPKPSTVIDMWRMIWQIGTNRIVMLTKEIENEMQKCVTYWPQEIGKTSWHGKIKVTAENIDVLANMTVTTLNVCKENVGRTVYHFQLTHWGDNESPKHPTPLLMLHQKVKSFDAEAKGLIVVHCSAGIGRTGTYIALDSLLQQAEETGKVDVFGFVNQMRTQRVKMIHKLALYVFVYDTLLEALSEGDAVPPDAPNFTMKQ